MPIFHKKSYSLLLNKTTLTTTLWRLERWWERKAGLLPKTWPQHTKDSGKLGGGIAALSEEMLVLIGRLGAEAELEDDELVVDNTGVPDSAKLEPVNAEQARLWLPRAWDEESFFPQEHSN